MLLSTFVKTLIQTLGIKIESVKVDSANERIVVLINESGQKQTRFVTFAEIERLFKDDTIQHTGASPGHEALPQGQLIPS